MNGKACAGTGEQVHLIIFTCARNAREVRARRKNEEGRKKKRKKEKEWELQVRKINGGKIYYRQKWYWEKNDIERKKQEDTRKG